MVSVTGICRISSFTDLPSCKVTLVIGCPPCPPSSRRPFGSLAMQIHEPCLGPSASSTWSTLNPGSVSNTSPGFSVSSAAFAGLEPSAGPYKAFRMISFLPAGAEIWTCPPSSASLVSFSSPAWYSTQSLFGNPGAVSPNISFVAEMERLSSFTAAVTLAVTSPGRFATAISAMKNPAASASRKGRQWRWSRFIKCV